MIFFLSSICNHAGQGMFLYAFLYVSLSRSQCDSNIEQMLMLYLHSTLELGKPSGMNHSGIACLQED